MKTSVSAMKKEMKSVNLDAVENVQDDMEDMLEEANEIQARRTPPPRDTSHHSRKCSRARTACVRRSTTPTSRPVRVPAHTAALSTPCRV